MSAELLRALTSKDKAVAEQAARALRELARADAAVLNGLRRELLQAAMAAEDLRVRWNLIIALAACR